MSADKSLGKTGTEVLAVLPSKSADVTAFDLVALDGLAQKVGVQLDGTVAERIDQAAMHSSRSLRHELACGLLLMSIKAECEHGEFVSLLASRGFETRGAQQSMQLARFVLGRSEAEREQLIDVQKSKVLQLAAADPEVIDFVIDEGIEKLGALSVRELRHRLRELEANAADLQVQRDTAEAEAEGLKKRLARGLPDRSDGVPLVVADLRAEIMALGKKASLAIDGFNPLGTDLVTLAGTEAGQTWADATLRLAVAQVQALQVQLDGAAKKMRTAFRDQDAAPMITSYLSQQEMREAAEQFDMLTQAHSYEAKLREWQREQAQPRGKGRPKAKPVAPGGEA